MMKKFSLIFLFAITFFVSGYTKPDVYVIDAEKNAIMHNNLGLRAISDKNYYTAVQEFFLAIALNPNTQATAVYYNNLGETYMKLGYFKDAQSCFEKAITQYNLDFLYYQNLVAAFKAQKIIPQKIKVYEVKSQKDSLNMIILGLLYVQSGNLRSGIVKLDEFCYKEPNLLITGAVEDYLKTIVPKN